MATIGSNVTLLDLKSGMDPDGKPAKIIEVLAQNNPIIDDMVWEEGNLPTGHQHSVRTGYPTPAWRQLNYGVPQTKGTQVAVTDTCGMLEDYSEIDKKLLALNGHSAAWRQQQDAPHLIGMSETFASTLFYGNTAVDPEKFLGLAPRFNSLSAANGQNIIDGLSGAAATNMTSVWLIGWSENTVRGIYPKGTKAGLDMEDLGEETAVDSNGLMHQVVRSHFTWDCGLAVSDWRYVVRIANINVGALVKGAGSGADLLQLMAQAQEVIQSTTGVRTAFYCNRRITGWLRRQMMAASNANLAWTEIQGKRVMTFAETPIRRTDAIINAESQVV